MRDVLIKFLETLNSDVEGELLSVEIPNYVDKILKFATIESISIDGRLKAFIAFYENDKSRESAFLTMIAVSKSSWQLGYGEELLKFSIKEIDKKGFKFYKLQVKEDNLKAIRLYQKYGFINVGVKDGVVNMEKQLY